MRFGVRAIIAALSLALGVGFLAPSQAEEYPQPSWHFLLDSVAYGTRTNVPGMNDWSCKPTAQHPRPVVLVHGTLGAQSTNWGSYSLAFKRAGYCVFALTYGEFKGVGDFPVRFGGLKDIRGSSKELRRFVKKVRKRTGAARVDLVGHSQGGLVIAHYLKNRGGAKSVDNAVALASPYKGVFDGVWPILIGDLGMWLVSAALPSYTTFFQQVTGSKFLKELNRNGVEVPGPKYLNIVTKYDEIAFPHEIGIMPTKPGTNVRNLQIQTVCANDYADHLAISADPNVFQIMDNTFSGNPDGPVQCREVRFITGVVD
ncbi:MAG TPA: alpha/beta fold hydrolase [Marmoricola sp.]|nr:alpha/beta fold hydrolase [Marmoricola sp.]